MFGPVFIYLSRISVEIVQKNLNLAIWFFLQFLRPHAQKQSDQFLIQFIEQWNLFTHKEKNVCLPEKLQFRDMILTSVYSPCMACRNCMSEKQRKISTTS